MKRTLATIAACLTNACIVYDSEPGPPPPPPPPESVEVYNAAPFISWADAGCYWDGYNYDWIWYFESDVDDPDGVLDVVAVYADVYDAYNGQWFDSFELLPTADPYLWFSDWLGSTTYLDCYYHGYLVDIVAYDSFDAIDVLTIEPLTYGY